MRLGLDSYLCQCIMLLGDPLLTCFVVCMVRVSVRPMGTKAFNFVSARDRPRELSEKNVGDFMFQE